MITLLIVISHRRIVPHRLSLLGINLDVHVIRLGKLQKTYLMINYGYASNTTPLPFFQINYGHAFGSCHASL